MVKQRRGIHLIAEMAKVSIGTVDRALHGRGVPERGHHRRRWRRSEALREAFRHRQKAVMEVRS